MHLKPLLIKRKLKGLANVVKKSLRAYDIFERFGGEEFLVMLPETSLQNAVIVMERLRQDIENYKFPTVNKITISCGVTEMDKEKNLDKSIERADKALYMAKENGRNQVIALEMNK